MEKSNLATLIKLTKPPKYILAIGAIFSLLSAIAGLIMPLTIKYFVEHISNGISKELIIFSIIAVIIWIVCSIISVYSLQYVGIKVVKNIRSKVWEKLIHLPVRYYDDEHSGELVSRVTNDTLVLKELVSNQIVEFATNIVVIIGSLVVLFMLDVPMTLVLILSVPLVLIIVMPMGSKIYKLSVSEQEEMAELTANLSQTLSEIRLIKAYGTEEKEIARGERNFKNLFDYGIKGAKIQSVLQPLIMISSMGIFIFVVAFGAYRVSIGAVTSGDLIAFLLYLFQVVMPVASMGVFFSQLQKAKGATERIHNILMEEEENLKDGEDIGEIENFRFEDIEYSYSIKKVLDKVSFSANKGEIVAIVGPSGVGKSTVFGVIEQFLKPEGGEIYVNDKSIKHYNIKSLRSKISYVQQDSPLLMGSIKENILYGSGEDVSYDDIKNAAILSGSYDFINRFEDGFNTLVGERGRNLSGGQKQRIAVARAILRNPSILLFDEATASLDTESERVIQEAINKVKDGKIVFVIAHRLSTVVDADKILVMQEGKISGIGTHKELILNHEFYRGLVGQQFLENV